jgi:hypothetical protein
MALGGLLVDAGQIDLQGRPLESLQPPAKSPPGRRLFSASRTASQVRFDLGLFAGRQLAILPSQQAIANLIAIHR